MESSASFKVTKIIPTNITSSLAMSLDGKNFAAITRQQSLTSSQWIYRLDFYDYSKLKLLETINIYQTYETNKHHLSFIPAKNDQLIALSTIKNLIFYRANPLRMVASFLHQQENVYDVSASPDGELTVLVGQQIIIYRTNGFRQITFPQVIQNARFCEFSRDSMYMVIASTGLLNVYTYERSNDNYNFQQIPLEASAPVNYGSITSVQFNPTNSSELIVGFLSASPVAYSLSNGVYFKKYSDVQPMSSQNAKIARYMPDGQRYYSYDYLKGIGLWPGTRLNSNTGPTYRLYYKEDFLMYDTVHNSNGTALIGYVWQTIKAVTIVYSNCVKSGALGCQCPTGKSWNLATFQCASLVCLQAEYSTGAITDNQCVCIEGYVFDQVSRKCAIDCSKIAHAHSVRKSDIACYCSDNRTWNAILRICQFTCTNIPYSTGIPRTAIECECISGFIWSESLNQCVCPSFMEPSNGLCVCISNYYYQPIKNKCLVNCSLVNDVVGETENQQACLCNDGYYFTIKNKQAVCQRNCSIITDTIQEDATHDGCICREHTDWFSVGNSSSCVVDCKAISFSDPSGQVNNTCLCAINYIWIDKIKQCAKNCTGVKNTILGADSTLISCPCIANFMWSEANNRCEIQCSKIANSEVYSLQEVDKCQCRPGFKWNTTNYSCQVNCQEIWNAEDRINDSYCKCKENQPFNNQTLTCGAGAASGFLDSPLAIAGFAVGILVVLIIAVALIKFCWGFGTEKTEPEKKIKAKDHTRKKGELIKTKKKVMTGQDQLKTNQRFVTPKKTATNTTL